MDKITKNKTTEFFYKLSVIVFYCGMPNFWVEDLNISKKISKIYRVYCQIIAVVISVFILVEVGAFFTDQNLNEKQEVDLFLYGTSHPMIWTFTIILSFKTTQVKEVLSNILHMKKVFNDAKVEQQMLKKSTLYSTAFISGCMFSMALFAFDGFLQVFFKGTTFTTVIVAWPQVDNNSNLANLFRVIWNICWWAMVSRSMGMYAMVICLITSMSHQFIDLQKYFYSLDSFFHKKNVRQDVAEIKFENAFKVGIDLFQSTLRCIDQSKVICGSIFSGQIIFNVIVLIITMSQMLKSEMNVAGTVASMITAACTLTGTGLFMCNAGDITVEASKLSTAIYSSGWQNCRGQRLRNVKKMMLFSMLVAQKPIVIYGLGMIELSYQSYVTLLKSTYSLFSLLFLN